ncbi:MAG: hypothetical protein EPO13_06820 [Actinomycetota bacterium]|nr:MAG: hypothetical protein EPO13_06820 [Actinomycetota bacterium]
MAARQRWPGPRAGTTRFRRTGTARFRAVRRGLAGCLAAIALVALSACTGTAGPEPSSGPPALHSCEQVACTGVLDGAAYEILLPRGAWNGTLLLFSHGYRAAQPWPPAFAPVSTEPEPAPGWSSGRREIGQQLLDAGYALAGSAYPANGWAVADGVAAGASLIDFFRTQVGTPQRVYGWGESLGGLITVELAEREPELLQGAVAVCAPLAGVVPLFDLGLDVAYGVRQLLVPSLQLTGFASYADAVSALSAAATAVMQAARDPAGPGGATLLLLDALGDGPTRTLNFDGHDRSSQVSAAAETVVGALAYGTVGRYEVEQRLGGNLSGNVGTDYAARVTAAEAAVIDASDAGATQRALAALAGGARVAADPAAVRAAASLGDPQGDLTLPLVTVHTAADPVVIVPNETWYRTRAEAAGAADRLRQYVTVPPASYPQQPGAPYGAGHCNVTDQTWTGAVNLLDSWVRSGVAPTDSQATAAFGPDSGLDPAYVLPPWPAGDPTVQP